MTPSKGRRRPLRARKRLSHKRHAYNLLGQAIDELRHVDQCWADVVYDLRVEIGSTLGKEDAE